jgi:2-C-methyl-D-erythritol 4-phosphate cytidylyltransferase
MVAWCLDAFAAAETVDRAVVAAPAGHLDDIRALAPKGLGLEVTEGGATRSESVALALRLVESDVVAVHDAARPLVTAELIDALVARLLANPDAAGVIAAVALTDTIKRVARGKGRIARTERRDELWAAQTPQVFRAEALRAAHAVDPARAAVASDDAGLVEQDGEIVLVEPASSTNIKVTTPADMQLAQSLLKREGELSLT